MTAAHQNAPGELPPGELRIALAAIKDTFPAGSPERNAMWQAMEALNARPQHAQVVGIDANAARPPRTEREVRQALADLHVEYIERTQPYVDILVRMENARPRTGIILDQLACLPPLPTPPPTSASPQVGGHPELLRIIMDEDYPYLAHDPTKGQAERRALLAAIAALTQPPAVSAEWVVDDAMIRRFVDAVNPVVNECPPPGVIRQALKAALRIEAAPKVAP